MNNIITAYERGYRVTICGQICSSNGPLKGRIGNRGYKEIRIRHGKKFLPVLVHRLQAFQKYGESMFAPGIVVRHLNGDRLDNTWNNILIGTSSDNTMDIPQDARVRKAIHASSKLKKYNNLEVIGFYNECKSYAKTMEHFKITSKGTLHHILTKTPSTTIIGPWNSEQ